MGRTRKRDREKERGDERREGNEGGR